MILPFDYRSHTRVIFGENAIRRLGNLAKELGFGRTLLVADRGIVEVGYVEMAVGLLQEEGVEVFPFHDFAENPDTEMIETGVKFSRPHRVDSIIGLGGGSSLDCAKGINFVLTNGGQIKDFWGFGKAKLPMLPSIAVPTTAGTGSEAQCYALISDNQTHVKMACGDQKAAFRLAILDPTLTCTQPPTVTAVTGYDAISHAVETYVSTERNALSELFSKEAFSLLNENYQRVLEHPRGLEARAAMQLGAHYAGIAIENSMLGATHACANPLTARYGTAHGKAIAMLLPAVVRWNSQEISGRYQSLLRASSLRQGLPSHTDLAGRLEELRSLAGLDCRLETLGVLRSEIPALVSAAVLQWTGKFNPRRFDADGASEIYESVF